MSDAFVQNKRRTGKGLTYFIINASFAAAFGCCEFLVTRNECYTIKGSNTPVTAETPGANDVTMWFDITLLLGFCFYGAAAVSSLGYLTLSPTLQAFSGATEKLSRVMTYIVFIAVHVMRLSHTGKVCAGDYLPMDARSDEVVQNYMINTGKFFMMYIILGWCVVPALLIIMVCLKGDKWAALALDAPK